MLGSAKNLRPLCKNSNLLNYVDLLLIDARNHGTVCPLSRLIWACLISFGNRYGGWFESFYLIAEQNI